MKTAVSLPDGLFQAAERHARRSRKSRSRLYADTIAEYLDRHVPDEVAVAMDRVVDRLGETPPDEFASRVARRTLERSEAQGEVWWAEPPEPLGSGPGLRRAVGPGGSLVKRFARVQYSKASGQRSGGREVQ